MVHFNIMYMYFVFGNVKDEDPLYNEIYNTILLTIPDMQTSLNK